ncbi:MAG TPA: transposase [Ruminococcus sp.]|nr:transposase [Ruminococcus sp.]
MSYRAIKIKLFPTREQEKLLWQSAGTARFAYNWAKKFADTYYRLYKKSLNAGKARKHFTKLRNRKKYAWLKEVSSEIPQQAIKDYFEALNKFFKKIAGYPGFKSRKRSTVSFYHSNAKFTVSDNVIKLEKIGEIRMKDDNRLPRGNYRRDKSKVCNPRVKYNGKYWYISLCVENKYEKCKLDKDLSVGIDLATVSNFEKSFGNINKTQRVRRLKKQLRRLQRQVSRKYEKNRSGNRYLKTNNIMKLERKIKLLHKRLSDIRLNYLHQVTISIAKTKPYRIVMEDLNVKGMMKNKHLAQAISEQGFAKFIELMKYKAEKFGIEFIQADRFYPSSKICSHCESLKKDLKLSERIYHCSCCGFTIDRDKNASINLANYKLA